MTPKPESLKAGGSLTDVTELPFVPYMITVVGKLLMYHFSRTSTRQAERLIGLTHSCESTKVLVTGDEVKP